MFCNSENYTITLPFSLILVFGSWHLCMAQLQLPVSKRNGSRLID